jgi:N-acetylglucosaminyldiphosphoundecaprenol N-acetyl-beta-D-mannosaminyltransferase
LTNIDRIDRINRINVLGVGVSAINMEQALGEIDRWISANQPGYICVCTVHGVMDCQRSEDLRRIFNSAGLVTPDGMPLVWLGRSSHRHVSRVYGPDLMLAELGRSVSSGHRHFFYGGASGVGERLQQKMVARFPGLQIAGVIEPPFASLDELATTDVASRINDSGADVVWVGIGSPKQERWMARMRPLLKAPVLVGVGAAFDFHSGSVRQAPRWMQRSGLEWAYRLATDPRRLWRRYLVDNPWFLWALALQKLGLRRYQIQ